MPPPPLHAPVSLVLVDPPRPAYQRLVPTRLDCERRPRISLPEDPAEVIRRKLHSLDCPANRGWKMHSQIGPHILCMCGGGSHQLSVDEVAAQMEPLGFSGINFRDFVLREAHHFENVDVNTFLKAYMDADGHQVVVALQSKRQKAQDQINLEESLFQGLLASKEDLNKQQQDACQSYEADFRKGQAKAERIFVKHCLDVASFVPGAEVNIDPAKTSVDKAMRELEKAKQLNESRVEAWAEWEEAVDCWSDVPEVFQHRPDLSNATFERDDAQAKAALLRSQADTVVREMEACMPDRQSYSSRLTCVQEEWARRIEEYHETCGSHGQRQKAEFREMEACVPDRQSYSSRLTFVQEEWACRIEEYHETCGSHGQRQEAE